MTVKIRSLKPIVPFYQLKRPIQWTQIFSQRSPLDVEIGFGMGEVLLREAANNPDRNYIGIEQHWERICKTLKKINVDNIRIIQEDVRAAFKRLFDSQSIDFVFCLFPCPWPKKGHVKHRLFSNQFLKLINSRLKKNGELKIVTDFYPYFEWVLEQGEGAGFRISTEKIEPQFGTKFERKWQKEGQDKFFEINMQKIKHIEMDVEEDVELKIYKVDHFDPKKIKLENVKGNPSVIFKDMLFDQEKKKAVIYTIVAEEELTQHFRISVKNTQNRWTISKEEGQSFFPTPGIARALELVYEATR